MSRTVLSRGRALASLTTVLGLALATAAVASSPASSATPVGDCDEPATVAALVRDQPVSGLTVSSGTAPERFTGAVIGVLRDGIAPGIDMVMLRLTSPEIDRVGGIWQGMSGSPVYTEAGDLVGAVAYGMSSGPSTVAGVTPFADMDAYLAAAPAATAQVPVGERAARAIARASGLTLTRAAEGFSRLDMPLGVSGISAQRLTRAEQAGVRARHPYLAADSYRMGSAAGPGEGPGAETIVAGGNLAASLSYGDVTAAGTGTATSVCADRVVGFGHPMTFAGETTLSLHPADALYIQEESLGAPFKVANLGAPVGTVTDDHLTGITGLLGATPDTVPVTSRVRYGPRQRTGSTMVSVQSFLPDGAFYQNVANHDVVIDGATKGSELQSWSITGKRENGTAFELAATDRYASESDITWASAWQVADFAYLVTRVPGVSVDAVSVSSAVKRDSSTYGLVRLQQRVGGAWVTVGKGAPVVAKAAGTLRMRAVLSTGSSTPRVVPFDVAVPARTLGAVGMLSVGGEGGGMFEGEEEYYEEDAAPTVASLQRALADQVRNDQLAAVLELESERGYRLVRARTTAQDKVVRGVKRVRVVVTR